MKITLILSLLLFSINVFAQGASGVGNGGSGVVCYSGPNGTGKMLRAWSRDLWEATHQAKLTISIGPKNLDELEKVKILISRVKRVDPTFGKEMEDRYVRFLDSYEIQNRVKIRKIDDTRAVVDPKGNCMSFQIAVNNKYVDKFFPKKFQFDSDVWELLGRDKNEQAALIFHELLYWTEIDLGADDSFGTRRMVGILASTEGSTLTQQQYVSMIKNYSLRKFYAMGNLSIDLRTENTLAFNENGQILRGKLAADSAYEVASDQYTIQYLIPKEALIEFDSSGRITQNLSKLRTQETRDYPDQQVSEKQGVTPAVLYKPWNTVFAAEVSSQTSDGRYAVLNHSDQKIYSFFESAGLRLVNAEYIAIEIGSSGQIIAVWLKTVPGKLAYILQDRQPNGKYELSWKGSNPYRVLLDPNTQFISKIE